MSSFSSHFFLLLGSSFIASLCVVDSTDKLPLDDQQLMALFTEPAFKRHLHTLPENDCASELSNYAKASKVTVENFSISSQPVLTNRHITLTFTVVSLLCGPRPFYVDLVAKLFIFYLEKEADRRPWYIPRAEMQSMKDFSVDTTTQRTPTQGQDSQFSKYTWKTGFVIVFQIYEGHVLKAVRPHSKSKTG